MAVNSSCCCGFRAGSHDDDDDDVQMVQGYHAKFETCASAWMRVYKMLRHTHLAYFAHTHTTYNIQYTENFEPISIHNWINIRVIVESLTLVRSGRGELVYQKRTQVRTV